MLKFPPLSFSYLVAAVFLVFFAGAYVFAWAPPASAPPTGNVLAPLNTGNTGQTKSGGLILNTGGAVNGLIIDKGKVGIGTTDPGSFLLKVAGEVSAGFNKVREVATPIASDDAATKGYVDSAAGVRGNGYTVLGSDSCASPSTLAYTGKMYHTYVAGGGGGAATGDAQCVSGPVLSDAYGGMAPIYESLAAGSPPTYQFQKTCAVCVK